MTLTASLRTELGLVGSGATSSNLTTAQWADTDYGPARHYNKLSPTTTTTTTTLTTLRYYELHGCKVGEMWARKKTTRLGWWVKVNGKSPPFFLLFYK